MSGALAGAATLGAVAGCSLCLHTGYGLLSDAVDPAGLVDDLD